MHENVENYKRSIQLLQESTIAYEFRTTVIKNYHTKEKIVAIAKSLQ
ncbi:hypothetical protein KBC03_07675 [Patescibacteria group bacterium]|nr:hypothetical protein [Patescibacteria group bacterium]